MRTRRASVAKSPGRSSPRPGVATGVAVAGMGTKVHSYQPSAISFRFPVPDSRPIRFPRPHCRVPSVMHVSFALFADAANLSQEGKLNILGVFDAVQVATMPSIHARATLVLRLKGSSSDIGRHTVAFNWANPNGDTLWSSLGELDVGAAGPPHQLS